MTLPPSPAALWAAATPAQIVVISGEIGAGKTRYCATLIDHVRAQGGRVGGLLSVGEFRDGVKVAITLHDLTTQHSRRLAIRRDQPEPASPTPRWHMDETTLHWGNAALATTPPCDLLIIDELGPLELLHGLGYQAAFPLLAQRAYRLACVVVRRTLVAAFTARVPADAVYDLSM